MLAISGAVDYPQRGYRPTFLRVIAYEAWRKSRVCQKPQAGNKVRDTRVRVEASDRAVIRMCAATRQDTMRAKSDCDYRVVPSVARRGRLSRATRTESGENEIKNRDNNAKKQ